MADFMRFGIDINVECYCGRKTILPYLPVLLKFYHEGWSHNLDSALGHFKCRKCGSTARHIGPHYR